MKGKWVVLLILAAALSGCSVKKYAVGKVGDILAKGGSTFESDEDLELVKESLPFAIKLVESLLETSPKHRGLLYSAAQGFTSYAYLAVQQDLDRAKISDYRQADKLRVRAKKLYLRGHAYGLQGLDAAHPGFSARLSLDPAASVAVLEKKDLPLLYWTAASLGLAISTAKDEAEMIARVPEVEALIDRGLALDASYREGAFHEFAIILAGAKPGTVDYAAVSRHYEEARRLSHDNSASLYVTYAETVAVPRQQRDEFRQLLERAMDAAPKGPKENRVMNELARRRADWLLGRIDDLILKVNDATETNKQEDR